MDMFRPDMVFLDAKRIDGMPLHVVRDDIYPFVGGGSKARKAVYYEKMLRDQGYNAVVTCGGIQSNHNRAVALMAARNGWKCHLCIQGTADRFLHEKGNAMLDRLSGAECELINAEDTAISMDNAMAKLCNDGYNPYYIHCGGHDLPLAVAHCGNHLAAFCQQGGGRLLFPGAPRQGCQDIQNH